MAGSERNACEHAYPRWCGAGRRPRLRSVSARVAAGLNVAGSRLRPSPGRPAVPGTRPSHHPCPAWPRRARSGQAATGAPDPAPSTRPGRQHPIPRPTEDHLHGTAEVVVILGDEHRWHGGTSPQADIRNEGSTFIVGVRASRRAESANLPRADFDAAAPAHDQHGRMAQHRRTLFVYSPHSARLRW